MSSHKKIVGVAVLLLLGGGSAHASGFAVNDKSVSSMGQAFAGGAALAEDASAVYNNPALLTQLEGTQLSIGVHRITSTVHYEDSGSNVSGPSSETAQRITPLPNIYFVTPVTPAVSAGVGVYVPYGLGLEYDADWKGRYHTIESQLQTLNVSPSLAWEVNEHVSLGASLDLQFARAHLRQAVDFGTICVAQQMQGGASLPVALANCAAVGLAPQANDGMQTLNGSSRSYGVSLGIAMESIDGRNRAGIVWHGPITQTLRGTSEFDDVPAPLAGTFTDSDGELSVTLPETLSVSFAHQASERLMLLADYTWTRWSRFDELRVKFANSLPDSVSPQDWHDAARYSVGMNYRLTPAWLLRAGVALDETPVPNAQLRGPRMPDEDRYWYTLGLNWQVTAGFSVDAAYAYVPAVRNVPIDNTDSLGHNLKGDYTTFVGQYLSLQGTWRF